MAKRLADAGVALTVLPSTDLYLMGRQHKHDHNVTRGVVPAHKLLHHKVAEVKAYAKARSERTGAAWVALYLH